MVGASLAADAKMILLTPTPDSTQSPTYTGDDRNQLGEHADQIRQLAAAHGIGLADSLHACQEHTAPGELSAILSWSNHPNRSGHELVVQGLLRWFPAG